MFDPAFIKPTKSDLAHSPALRGWPLSASLLQGNLKFSGYFDRWQASKWKNEHTWETVYTALFGMCVLGGLLALAFHIWVFPAPDRGPRLLMAPSAALLTFWSCLLVSLYLLALFRYRRIKRQLCTVRIWKRTVQTGSTTDVFDYFSDEARATWLRAYDISRRHGGTEVRGTDIVFSLLQDAYVVEIFRRFDVNVTDIKIFLLNYLVLEPPVPAHQQALLQLPYLAFANALKLNLSVISPLVLFLALAEAMPQDHIVHAIFANVGLDREKLKTVIVWLLGVKELKHTVRGLQGPYRPRLTKFKAPLPLPTHYLRMFDKDLTAAAKAGVLLPALGREADLAFIERALEENHTGILLTGESGTGRRAVVSELAYRMVSGRVGDKLRNKWLVEVDSVRLLQEKKKTATTLYRILAEAADLGNVILFIPMLDTLLAPAAEKQHETLTVLLDFLRENPLSCLATATPEGAEALRAVPGFEGIFISHPISPLSGNQLLLACCLRASFLEAQNNLLFRYAAIQAAVDLTAPAEDQPQRAIAVLVKAAGWALERSESPLFRKTKDGKKIITEHIIRKVAENM